MAFRPYIQLFIDGKEVDFTEPIEVNMTYAHNDLHNPTIIKNSFSKTLKLDGTPKNNQIFGCFGDMQRIISYSDGSYSGAFFNPSRKTDFILMRNYEIMERGYVKLDKVTKKGNRLTYEITLFGGLGQFLYGLSYKDDGEKMKLSDLIYEYDIDLQVNAETIRDAWNHINGLSGWNNPLYGFINFAPCYNGVPENFTADKVAIDINTLPEDFVSGITTSKNGYGAVGGWILGELQKEYDEWQMKDLRSYLQRPVVRMKEIVKAVVNPINNGGYVVDLDEDFFSESNPYYEDAWMTLPLLTEMEKIESITEVETYIEDGNVFVRGLIENQMFNINVRTKIGCNAVSNASYLQTCYVGSSWDGSDESAIVDESTNFARYIQLIAYDKDDNKIGASAINSFFSYGTNNNFSYSPVIDAPVNRVSGTYHKTGDGTYIFNNSFYDFTIKNLKYEDGIYFKLVEKFAYDNGQSSASPNEYELYDSKYNAVDVNSYMFAIDENVEVTENSGLNWFINKKNILNSEHTPCDYFLGYLKMFNLHIWSDNVDKKIYIRQRNNYFDNSIVNVDDLVDRDSEITIKPIVYDAKYYNFGVEYNEDGYLNKVYKDNYGFDYGIQKVNTNYNFDNSSKDLLENIVYKGAIMNRGKSKYYVDIFQTNYGSYPMPSFILDGCQTFLFNSSGDTVEGTYITPKTTANSTNWWTDKGYDLFPKPDFRDKDGKGIDGANVLLFYNGAVESKDVDGNYIRFFITDDIPEFESLNDGEPCWIWSRNMDYKSANIIPMFSRYRTSDNNTWVTHSWDFGTPKQIYISDYSIDNSSDIYTRYWKTYITDEFDMNTREVDLKIRFKGKVNPDFLMNFIYYDGAIWKIMEIIDYNVTSQECTKVKMVKVQDINNYLN